MQGRGSRNYDPRSTTRSMACLTSVFIQADLKTVTSSQALSGSSRGCSSATKAFEGA
jgi:ribosomal protein S12 methylthiotransferase accessory factor YcaO